MCKENIVDSASWLLHRQKNNMNLSDHGCNSFVTNLTSRHMNNKKDIKFSKTTQKRISHENRGLRLESKKI